MAQKIWLGFRAEIHYQQGLKCKYGAEARVQVPRRLGVRTKELSIGDHIDIYTGSFNSRLREIDEFQTLFVDRIGTSDILPRLSLF